MTETADVLDGTLWDFDPEEDLLSPLVTTERYFRDFPWEATGEGEGTRPEPAGRGDEEPPSH